MPVLVSEDVRLCEGPPRAELGLELVEEAEVDVDVAVVRAVERADRGRRAAASGLDRAVEESRRSRLVATERLRPVRLDAVDAGQNAAVLALVRVLAGRALLGELPRRLARPDGLAGERAEIPEPASTTEKHEGQDDEEDDDPAAPTELHRDSARSPPPRPR